MNKLQAILANKHTSGAGIVFIVCKGLAAQFPQYQPLCNAISDAAVLWMALLAGDAKPINGNTALLTDETPTKL